VSALTARQRLESRLARGVSLLSPRFQVLLSGRRPVQVDGLTLEPELQLILAALGRYGRPPYHAQTLASARAQMRRGAIVGGGPPPPVGSVRSLPVAGAVGTLAARHYCPDEPGGPHPLIVFYHGGGFVLGGLDSHDAVCRMLCRHAGAHVLSVDYRLAPEHRFPAAVDDAAAAFGWACEHAGVLGADAARIAVAGDSAGGNLAAVTAARAVRDGTEAPVLQLLIYPATDFARRARSHKLFAEGFPPTQVDMDWFVEQYVGSADIAHPDLSVIGAPELSRVAPAIVITAGFDPLRDEGEAYAVRLRQAGVPVLARRYPGLIHGFATMVGVSRSARDAVLELAGAARAMLGGVTERLRT
jgi:acetyl esterase